MSSAPLTSSIPNCARCWTAHPRRQSKRWLPRTRSSPCRCRMGRWPNSASWSRPSWSRNWPPGSPRSRPIVGRGVDDPAESVRFDLTPAGLHAQILSPRGAVYVEPYLRGNTNLHAAYYRRDYRPAAPDFQCLVSDSDAAVAPSGAMSKAALAGGNTPHLSAGLRGHGRIHELLRRDGVRRSCRHRHRHQPRDGSVMRQRWGFAWCWSLRTIGSSIPMPPPSPTAMATPAPCCPRTRRTSTR